MFETRKFLMAILHWKQGSLCDKNVSAFVHIFDIISLFAVELPYRVEREFTYFGHLNHSSSNASSLLKFKICVASYHHFLNFQQYFLLHGEQLLSHGR